MTDSILAELQQLAEQQARVASLITTLVREWRRNAQDKAARDAERALLSSMISGACDTANALETIFGGGDGQEDAARAA